MRPLRRPTKSTIYYLGRESECGHHAVTLSINGIRWVYGMSSQQADTVEHLAHKVSPGKALAFAKSHASAATRLTPLPSTTLFQRHRGAQASRAKRIKPGMPKTDGFNIGEYIDANTDD